MRYSILVLLLIVIGCDSQRLPKSWDGVYTFTDENREMRAQQDYGLMMRSTDTSNRIGLFISDSVNRDSLAFSGILMECYIEGNDDTLALFFDREVSWPSSDSGKNDSDIARQSYPKGTYLLSLKRNGEGDLVTYWGALQPRFGSCGSGEECFHRTHMRRIFDPNESQSRNAR